MTGRKTVPECANSHTQGPPGSRDKYGVTRYGTGRVPIFMYFLHRVVHFFKNDMKGMKKAMQGKKAHHESEMETLSNEGTEPKKE